jgi:hypothetical protein
VVFAVLLAAVPSLAGAQSGKELIANCKNALPQNEVEAGLGRKVLPDGFGPVGYAFLFVKESAGGRKITKGTKQGTTCVYAPPAAARKEAEESIGMSVAFNESPAVWKNLLRENRASIRGVGDFAKPLSLKLGRGIQSVGAELSDEVPGAPRPEGEEPRSLNFLGYTPAHNIFYIQFADSSSNPIVAEVNVAKLATTIARNLDKEWNAVKPG